MQAGVSGRAPLIVKKPRIPCPPGCDAWHGIGFSSRLLGVSRRTIYDLIDSGRLAGYQSIDGRLINHRQLARYERPLSSVSPYDRGHWIYLFEMVGFSKIGHTRNVPRRLFGFEGLPFEVKLEHSFRTRRPKPAEAFLHGKFDGKRVRAKVEWFRLCPDDVTWFKSLADYQVDSWLAEPPPDENAGEVE